MPGSCVTEPIPTNGQPVPLGERGARVNCPLHTWGGCRSSGIAMGTREGLDRQPVPLTRCRLVCLCWSGGQQGRTPVVRGAPRGALNHPGVVLDTLSELPPRGVLETANRWAAHPTTGDHGRRRCLPVFPSCATRELRCPDGTVQTSILPRGSSAKVGPVVPRLRCALLSLSCQRGAPPCPSLRTKGPPAVALR